MFFIFLFNFFLHVITSFIPCGKFGSPYLDKATAAARAALPIPSRECGIFVSPNEWYGCQCLGSLKCAQMLKHAIAHEGCTDTVRESALKFDSGEKNPCRTSKPNLCQRCASLTLYQLSYIPNIHEKRENHHTQKPL